MSEYDDNIDDLPQKQQPQTATVTSYALTTTGIRKATSKFKPALGDITSGSEASHVTLRRKAAVASTSGLPVFSTPGFGKKPLSSASGPMSAPPLNREVLEIPSDDPPLDVAEHVPTKRIASELPEPAQGNSSKRFKSAASVHKENVPRKSPKGKARATSRHWTPDHREASSDIDCLNFGISHTKPPADPFKFARNFASSSTPIFARPRPPPALQPSPQKNASGDSSDLSSKPQEVLQSLLDANQEYRSMVGGLMSQHINKTGVHDIVILSLLLDRIDARICALKERITPLEGWEEDLEPMRRTPAPFPMLTTTSTLSRSSIRQHETIPTTPPFSMAVSDSSSTTLGTLVTMNASANSTEETAIPIDSPVMVELDLDDASGATLAVPDSDDKLYDMFDPISPEDIPLLTAEKPQAPSPSTPASGSSSASTSTTVGRIDHTASPYYKEVITILKTTFKLSTFRTNQLECIVATLDGKDVFYLAPTGGGKSLCFQLPALCVTGKTQGTTFVISPLISLITDQVSALRSKGVNAWCLTSAAEENEVREVMRMMRSSVGEKPKLVYTTPERLQKSDCLKDVVNQLYEEKQLARFVVDEAHVIGSWGRDFRASYAELKVLRKSWPGVPIMALTGSANKDAIEDIKRNLAMQNPICLAQSFNRPNLHYEVRKKPAQKKNLVQAIAGFIKSQHSADTGIIYCLSRAESEEMAQKLREDFGLEARHYHAGINNEERKNNQDDWMAGRCKIIVATVAFGMGIDKPDVRFVIHAALSKDMDGYYQETGRAGRDGQPSDCILFYTWNDAVKLEKMIRNPNTNDPSRGAPDETEIDRQISKLQAVVAYCSNESDCRRVLLLRHFDEEFKPENCHKQCDNCCRPGTLVRHDFTAEAQQVIRLLEEMIAVNSRGVTQGQVIDTWKGKNGKNVQQYKGVSLYAAGKALDHTTVDRILNNLVAEKMISLYRVVSSSGYSNNYIQVGSAGQECLDGHRPFVVAWKEMDGGNQNSSRSSNKPAPSKKPNHFPSLASGDEPAAVAGGKDDIETLRLERLREKRRWLSERFGRVEETVLQDDTLQMMALMPPEDEAAFRHIVAECEDPNSVNDKWNMFGKDFLDALRPQHPTVGPSSCKAFDATRMRQDFEFNG